jgi:hypothetical protein
MENPMAKYQITSYDSDSRTTGTTDVEASSIHGARAAADQVETETGAQFTTIHKESPTWGYVAERRH